MVHLILVLWSSQEQLITHSLAEEIKSCYKIYTTGSDFPGDEHIAGTCWHIDRSALCRINTSWLEVLQTSLFHGLHWWVPCVSKNRNYEFYTCPSLEFRFNAQHKTPGPCIEETLCLILCVTCMAVHLWLHDDSEVTKSTQNMNAYMLRWKMIC